MATKARITVPTDERPAFNLFDQVGLAGKFVEATIFTVTGLRLIPVSGDTPHWLYGLSKPLLTDIDRWCWSDELELYQLPVSHAPKKVRVKRQRPVSTGPVEEVIPATEPKTRPGLNWNNHDLSVSGAVVSGSGLTGGGEL